MRGAHNYLGALAEAGAGWGSPGSISRPASLRRRASRSAAARAALARLAPAASCCCPTVCWQRQELFETWAEWKSRLTPLPSARFDSEGGTRRLETFYGVAALDGFGAFTRAEIAAMGRAARLCRADAEGPAAADRAAAALRRRLGHGDRCRDAAQSRTGAGPFRRSPGQLLASIDRTLTGAGARLLAQYLAAPLTDPQAIEHRLDVVQFFVDRREAARSGARGADAQSRYRARLEPARLGRGGPRDLAAIRDGLDAARRSRRLLAPGGLAGPPQRRRKRPSCARASRRADRARSPRRSPPELPLLARDGGFIAQGAIAPSSTSCACCATRAAAHRSIWRPDIAARRDCLVEDPAQQHDRLLHRGDGRRTPTSSIGAATLHPPPDMADAVRFTTVELAELESEIAQRRRQGAGARAGAVRDAGRAR